MSNLVDLVEDTKLETEFINDSDVCHIYVGPDHTTGRRSVTRREYWKRKKRIGTGYFAAVWLEECTSGRQQGELRAVKQYQRPPQSLKCHRELETIAKLSQPKYASCFARSFGWYEKQDTLYLTMEYFPLGDLSRYLQQLPRPLPEQDVQQITLQILEGLNFMHKSGFAHRDIKPAVRQLDCDRSTKDAKRPQNTLIQAQPPQEWWVKITDFGLSKRFHEGHGTSSTSRGTDAYLAPELLGFASPKQAPNSKSPMAADIWALGEMTHQLLTKNHVFDSMYALFQYTEQHQDLPMSALVACNISPFGRSFVKSAMAGAPQQRMKTTEALLDPWIREVFNCPPIATAEAPPSRDIDSKVSLKESAGPILRPMESLPKSIMARSSDGTESSTQMVKPTSKAVPTSGHLSEHPAAPTPRQNYISTDGTTREVIRIDLDPVVVPGEIAPIVGISHRITKVSDPLLEHPSYAKQVRALFSWVPICPGPWKVSCSRIGELAFLQNDGTVAIWNCSKGTSRVELLPDPISIDTVHSNRACVGIHPHGKLVAYGHPGGVFVARRRAGGWRKLGEDETSDEIANPRVIRPDRVLALAFNDTTTTLVSCAEGNYPQVSALREPLWRTTFTQIPHVERFPKHASLTLSLSSDGAYVAVADNRTDMWVRIHTTSMPTLWTIIPCSIQPCRAMAFAPDYPRLAIEMDEELVIFDVSRKTLERGIPHKRTPCTLLVFSDDGKFIVGCDSTTFPLKPWVRVWRHGTGECRDVFLRLPDIDYYSLEGLMSNPDYSFVGVVSWKEDTRKSIIELVSAQGIMDMFDHQ